MTDAKDQRLAQWLTGTVWGAASGALLLGIGGRGVMRLLSHSIDQTPVFSLGGSIEVVAYGAIVGGVAGLTAALLRRWLPREWWQRALIVGSIAYAGTIATLPGHIAQTMAPFAQWMPLVAALFGLCFLAFGAALAALDRRISNINRSP